MNLRVILHLTSFVLGVVATGMVLCLLVSLGMGDSAHVQRAFGISAGATLLFAIILFLLTRGEVTLKRKESYAVVTFAWLLAALFGALPYMLSGVISDVPGALFESMSGLTTTGASVLSNLDTQPKGILFWRSVTQWLGGMGVLVLVIAIVPFLGYGAMGLYQAEIPGVAAERLVPKIAQTARILWFVYVVLTVACLVALKLCGMSWFDSVNHAFCTVSTGGFSTHPESIEGYGSLSVEMIIMFFMLLGGINFALHFRALKHGPRAYILDTEVRFMAAILVVVTSIMAISLWQQDNSPVSSLPNAIRAASFECVSILTTTGFGGHATQAFQSWSVVALTLVGIISFFGACSGSTSGGMKLIRLLLAFKVAYRELKLMVIPRAVYCIRMDGEVVKDRMVARTVAFLLLFVVIAAVSAEVMTFFAPDEITAVSSVYACMTNVGPGVGKHIGPDGNFAVIDAAGKIYLSLLMLIGRLEIFTFLVIFTPVFWRR